MTAAYTPGPQRRLPISCPPPPDSTPASPHPPATAPLYPPPNSKHRFTKSFNVGGRCRKAMLGVCLAPSTPPSPPTHTPRLFRPYPPFHPCPAPKLQALVYDLLPPATANAVIAYLIGLRNPSAKPQCFLGDQMAVSLNHADNSDCISPLFSCNRSLCLRQNK